ncbi:hypothetical protein [Anaerocellum danielii]|uniref:Uncharacterized protein n=1 Tax=Anaerocellum danielii TaxID=1387557 RepID=A0ABZ0U1Y2_9FIRM|nr:hypothetical protein [Caldicellulosiruptor danielii]WPX08205.1 hypothetical protein SOJ16_002071 [Caldicellulosiruptor danielii]
MSNELFEKLQNLHREGFHVEIHLSYLSITQKEHEYYTVVLYKDFKRSVGTSTRSLEEAYEIAYTNWAEQERKNCVANRKNVV